MAYGTPASLADVRSYYTHIRRGRPPTAQLLAELVDRYRAIGGSSPLLAVSRAQARGLQRLLESSPGAGGRIRVELGMKHAPPFIEDGVGALVRSGAKRAVGLVLAPHYSALSVGEYLERARRAADGRLQMRFVEQWHLEPSYVDLLAGRVRCALRSLAGHERERAEVVFTAHSLPVRILAQNDPYPVQLEQTAAAVAERLELERWSVAWQSAGRTDEPWIGPDILDVLRERAAGGTEAVVACPAGFTSDHLETLYDLDVECRKLAAELGIVWRRTRSFNADPAFLRVLAGIVLQRSRLAPARMTATR